MVIRESASLDSVGIALTVFLPSAFVALSPMSDSITYVPRLRIIAAGAWHNLLAWILLYLLSSSGSEKLWPLLGYDDVSNRGLAVLDVENVSATDSFAVHCVNRISQGSPFAYHLTPGGSIITALDDTSLARQDVTGEDDVWSHYLLTPIGEQVPLERGWCVEAKWFNGR
jgi:S2P endopeptidase